MVRVCGKSFVVQPGHVRFCCAPPGHATDPSTDHIVIFGGRALRYAVSTSKEN